MIDKRKAGRPEWRPKNPIASKALVTALASFGHPHETIGRLLTPACGATALRKHFAEELDTGAATFRARVEATWAAMALGVPEVRNAKGKVIRKAIPPDKTMLIFMLKTRYEYRERDASRLTGLEGLSIANLSDAQLAHLIDRINRAIVEVRDSETSDDANKQVH